MIRSVLRAAVSRPIESGRVSALGSFYARSERHAKLQPMRPRPRSQRRGLHSPMPCASECAAQGAAQGRARRSHRRRRFATRRARREGSGRRRGSCSRPVAWWRRETARRRQCQAGKERAPAIGAKLQPDAISLAKKNDKKDEAQKPRLGNPGGVQPAPDSLPGASPARSARRPRPLSKVAEANEHAGFFPTAASSNGIGDTGAVEKYNKRGSHLGEFDHNTGAQTKPADRTRKVDP